MKRKAHPHDHEAEINLVPYLDIMVNLVMFMLVSMATATLAVVNVNMPDLGPDTSAQDPSTPPPQPDKDKLTLNVSISTRGFYLAGSGGLLSGEGVGEKVDPNTAAPTIPCKRAGADASNPCKVDEYDYNALTLKMASIKQKYHDTSSFFLAADPLIKYEIVVKTMDATRGDSHNPLFPDVAFAAVQ